MIDKLSLTAKDIDISSFRAQFGDTLTIKPQNNLYDVCERVSLRSGEHLFTAYYGPRNPNMQPFKLELNPSKLGLKYHDLLTKLDKALDIEDSVIQRIDHACDYDIPVSLAYECIRVKRKRNVRTYGEYKAGGLTGFWAGSKFEKFVIYNKAYELRGKTFKPVSDSPFKFSTLTRFELRHNTKKIPYRSLKELPFLIDYDPFEGLEVMELKEEFKDEFSDFRRENRVHGFQNTFMKLNKHNNFRRDYFRYFKLSDLPSKLRSGYRANLGQFFEDNTPVY